jgi:integrase
MDTTYFDSRDFEMFRQGIRRVKGEPAPRTALPITLPILSMVNRTILERGPLSSYERLLIATAFSVAFACFLRVGEITYTEFDPLVHLQRQDVLFSPQGLSIRIKASKTDPSRKGIILPLPVISTPAYSHVCPSNLLRMLLASTPGQPSDPLFCFASGKKNFDAKRLIRECRQALMQNGFSIADMDGRMFSGHSFRRGAATWAAKVGLNDRTIMLLGRWSVKSLPGGHQRYVDITLEDRRAYVSALYSASPGLENRQMGFIFEEDPAELEYMDDGLPPQ